MDKSQPKYNAVLVRPNQPADRKNCSAPNKESLTRFTTDQANQDNLIVLAREICRLLNTFNPVFEYPRPDEPALIQLSQEMRKDLGASSLDDFYGLALGEKYEMAMARRALDRPAFTAYFPKGPESLKPALTHLAATIERLRLGAEALKKAVPTHKPGLTTRLKKMKHQYETLSTAQTALKRAARLWPELKNKGAGLAGGTEKLWLKAKKLEEAVNLLTKNAAGPERSNPDNLGDYDDFTPSADRYSLTRVAADLRRETTQAASIFHERAVWRQQVELFRQETETLIAAFLADQHKGRDWVSQAERLSARHQELQEQHNALLEATTAAHDKLKTAFNLMINTEKKIKTRSESETKDRAERLLSGLEATWASTVNRRQKMASLYFNLPRYLGRPDYFEKLHLSTALNLGRTQGLLEELKNRLTIFNGKLSSTHALRTEAAQILERMKTPLDHDGFLDRAGRRLNIMTAGRLEQAQPSDDDGLYTVTPVELELKAEMAYDPQDGEADIWHEQTDQRLKAATLENDRLRDELLIKQKELVNLGLVKSQMVKLLQRKDKQLQDLADECKTMAKAADTMKAERASLGRRQSRLAEYYRRDREKLKQLNAELSSSNTALKTASNELKLKTDDFNLAHDLLAIQSEERERLLASLKETKKELDALTAERREMSARIKEAAADVDAFKIREAGLRAEMERHREELEEASRQRDALKLRVTHYRRKIDRLTMAHMALAKLLKRRTQRMTEAEDRSQDLTLRLDRQKDNLLNMVAARQELMAELGSARLRLGDLEAERETLIKELEQARVIAGEEAGRNVELSQELAAIKDQIDHNLKPLIDVLGLTLWRSESQLKRARQEAELSAVRGAAKEADIRLRGAARELELTGLIKQQEGHFAGMLDEKQTQLTQSLDRQKELLSENDGLKDVQRQSEEEINKLNLAVAALGNRSKRLVQAVKDVKGRYSERLEETEDNELELGALIRRQGQEIERQKENLRRLTPLVSFFISQAALAAKNEGLDHQTREMLDLIQAENEKLRLQLTEADGHKQTMAAEKAGLLADRQQLAVQNENLLQTVSETEHQKQALASENDDLRSNQQQLAALTGDLRQENSETLAQKQALGLENAALRSSQQQLAALTGDLRQEISETLTQKQVLGLENAALRSSQQQLAALNGDLRQEISETLAQKHALAEEKDFLQANHQRLAAQLEQVQPVVAFLAKSFVKNVAALTQARQERYEMSLRLTALQTEKTELASKIANLTSSEGQARGLMSTQKILSETLDARLAELTEVRDQALAATVENERLTDELSNKDQHILQLTSNIEATENELSEQKGKIESAWAALNYMGSRANDMVARMKAQVDNQARNIEDLHKKLHNSTGKIKDLESNLDKLALLYWFVVSKAAPLTENIIEGELLEAPPLMIEAQESKSDNGEETTEQPQDDNLSASGGGFFGSGLLETAKRVARKSVFSLVLAGALVMSPTSPIMASDAPGPNLVDLPNLGGLTPLTGQDHINERLMVASRLNSSYLGRTVDVSFISHKERLGGQAAIEKTVSRKVADLASQSGIDVQDYVKLVKLNYQQDDTVFTADLAGEGAPLFLAGTHFPKIIDVLSKTSPTQEELSMVLKAAAALKPTEGQFWDRIFSDILSITGDPHEALDGVMGLFQRKALYGKLRPEFAGRLAPLPELENMGSGPFINFIAGYIKTNWRQAKPKGESTQDKAITRAQRLAGDIFAISKIFNVPRTFMLALAHHENNQTQNRAELTTPTLATYSAALKLAGIINRISTAWRSDWAPLCDLDQVALVYGCDPSYPEAVYNCKQILLTAYNKSFGGFSF